MASLLYLKHAFNLSDSDLVQRWSQDVIWQMPIAISPSKNCNSLESEFCGAD